MTILLLQMKLLELMWNLLELESVGLQWLACCTGACGNALTLLPALLPNLLQWLACCTQRLTLKFLHQQETVGTDEFHWN
jgi:hypothetical protein